MTPLPGLAREEMSVSVFHASADRHLITHLERDYCNLAHLLFDIIVAF